MIYADPPWLFKTRSDKGKDRSPEKHYPVLSIADICNLPVSDITKPDSVLLMWVVDPLLDQAFKVIDAWGFKYKTNIVWTKIRKDQGPDGRGVGFYFRNTTELVLFGVKGNNVRTKKPGRTQVNIIQTRKREHSRKPDELYEIIEKCSWGPFLELFARGKRKKWTNWGNQSKKYTISWNTYKNNSKAKIKA